MPNQPKTPLHAFRYDEGHWREAQERARENGETVSDVIRRALDAYRAQPSSETDIAPDR